MSMDAIALLCTAVAALAASASAVLAARYTSLTMRLVRLQGEPKVVVYVTHDRERPSILVLVVKNIGHDMARNISFLSDRPLPKRAFGIAPEDAGPSELMTDGPFVKGIPELGPGEQRDVTWGQYGGLKRAIGDVPIHLTFAYEHGAQQLRGTADLEIDSFLETDASTKSIASMAKSLEKIATGVGRLSDLGDDFRAERSRAIREAELARIAASAATSEQVKQLAERPSPPPET